MHKLILCLWRWEVIVETRKTANQKSIYWSAYKEKHNMTFPSHTTVGYKTWPRPKNIMIEWHRERSASHFQKTCKSIVFSDSIRLKLSDVRVQGERNSQRLVTVPQFQRFHVNFRTSKNSSGQYLKHVLVDISKNIKRQDLTNDYTENICRRY